LDVFPERNEMSLFHKSFPPRSVILAFLSTAVLVACGGGTGGADVTTTDSFSASDTTMSAAERYRRKSTTTTTAPTTTTSSTTNSVWTQCAEENGICSFSGTHSVKYGVTSAYVTRSFTSSAACDNATFGDPAVGQWKYCWVDSDSASTTAATTTTTAPATTTTSSTPPVTPPVTAPAIEYLGRFDMSNPAQPHFSWSGSTIKARFNGTSVSVDLSNIYANNYTYSIDGGAPTIFTLGDGTPRTTTVLATGLSAGFHTVQVTRNNSTFDGETVFYGFNFGSGTLAAPAAYASPLRLEVYGDSIGAAGGITGSNCSDIIAAEDAYLGYAHVATRTLGAQAPTLIVYSGHGISHGYNSELGARTIPALYNQTGVGSQIWNFPAATAPNVVVIALGTNDISDVPSTGQFPSDATMTAAYVSFANTLRSKYPSAMFVMTVGPMTFGYQAAVTAAVSQLHSAGDSNVYSLIHSAQTLTGCAGHPGVAQHAVMAKDLVAFLHNHGY
jgi:lysophospholipase L1-like esterase